LIAARITTITIRSDDCIDRGKSYTGFCDSHSGSCGDCANTWYSLRDRYDSYAVFVPLGLICKQHCFSCDANHRRFIYFPEKNGFVMATKLGTTDKTFVAATKNFATATKCFVDRTKHFVVVTKCFCYPYFNKQFC